LGDIETVSYAGQPANMKQYKSGFEHFFNQLQDLKDADSLLDLKIKWNIGVMNSLSTQVSNTEWIRKKLYSNQFVRTILALESPLFGGYSGLQVVREGREVITAQWGDGYTSPVHGHSAGLLYEQLLYGRMRVNTYRLPVPTVALARVVETTIYSGWQNIAARYNSGSASPFARPYLIHNFVSVGESASVHYVPEHTRDGRDNQFKVEYFEDVYGLNERDLERSDSLKAMYSQVGDVYLVRSQNVPEYGDHYIVITGHPVVKQHGLRPQDRALTAPHTTELLDSLEPRNGLTIMKLKAEAKEAFYEFHGIDVLGKTIIFPNA
jgi:hypothetical protein